MASDFIRVPPRPRDIPPGFSGAPEKIVSIIADKLVEREYNVTLFASGDSETKASLISLQKKATCLDPEIGEGKHVDFEYALISKCFQMANKGNFDIIYSNFDYRSAFFAPFSKIPVVSILHSPLVGNKKRLLESVSSYQYYVSISNAQRKNFPNLPYIATIYHGVDLNDFDFSEKENGYLAIVGRVHPYKGIEKAATVARKINKKLLIIGSHDEKDYWKNKVKPKIDNKYVVYLGQLPQDKVIFYLKTARAFLFPIQWEEPFGLVMIEAMACGTPVVAFARGSVPEIVVDGKTGFIVNSSDSDKRGNWIVKKTGLEGFEEAVRKIYEMPEEEYRQMRQNCRKHVEENFTIEKMIDGYEAVYKKVIKDFNKK